MTEKYFCMNDEIFMFHPDTHEVFRVAPQRFERLDHPEDMQALRLRSMEITRKQAELAVPSLQQWHRQAL